MSMLTTTMDALGRRRQAAETSSATSEDLVSSALTVKVPRPTITMQVTSALMPEWEIQ